MGELTSCTYACRSSLGVRGCPSCAPSAPSQHVAQAKAVCTAEARERRLDALADIMTNMAHLYVARELVQPAFSYSSSKITQVRDPGFRSASLAAYGYTRAQCEGHTRTLPCLILDHPVPARTLAVGHIFKHEWAAAAPQVMGFTINDTRNALPIFKPLEYHFDTLSLAIVVEAGDVFRVRVLNPGLLDKKLVDEARVLGPGECPALWRDPTLEAMTFRRINGRCITFYSEHRPYTRCLEYHARQAFTKAKLRGWVTSDEVQKFGTPVASSPARVAEWLEQLEAAAAPPDHAEPSAVPTAAHPVAPVAGLP